MIPKTDAPKTDAHINSNMEITGHAVVCHDFAKDMERSDSMKSGVIENLSQENIKIKQMLLRKSTVISRIEQYIKITNMSFAKDKSHVGNAILDIIRGEEIIDSLMAIDPVTPTQK